MLMRTPAEKSIFCTKLISRFINSCSHEFRSPLASIQGLINVARYREKDEETAICLDKIMVCTEKMQKLLRDLEVMMVNLQRELLKQEVDAEELVNSVLEEFHHEIKSHKIEVSTEISQRNTWVTDKAYTYLITKQLVDNAIQFSDETKQDPKISIRLNVSNDHTDVEVSDNGVGIGESQTHRIFDIFHRSSEKSQGHGVGLFMVKALCQKLGASCTVKSKEKHGTSFHLSIPHAFCFFMIWFSTLFFPGKTFGQHFSLSPLVEQTIAGTQYGSMLSFDTKRDWSLGAFWQTGIARQHETTNLRNVFYGAATGVPLVRSSTINFSAMLRFGLVNKNFFVVAPGVETSINISERFKIGIGTSIRMQRISASARIAFRLF